MQAKGSRKVGFRVKGSRNVGKDAKSSKNVGFLVKSSGYVVQYLCKNTLKVVDMQDKSD